MILRIPNSNQVYSINSVTKVDSRPIKISDIPTQEIKANTTPAPKVETLQDVKPVDTTTPTTPTPTPTIPTIKATPAMTLGKPSVQ